MTTLRNSVGLAAALALMALPSTAQQEPVEWADLMTVLEELGTVRIDAEEHPVVLVSAEQVDTVERGLLSLEWQMRRITSLELRPLDSDRFFVAAVDRKVLSKAPLGRWREIALDEETGAVLPEIGTPVNGVPH